MTPDEFETLIESATRDEFIHAVSVLSEETRQSLVEAAEAAHKANARFAVFRADPAVSFDEPAFEKRMLALAATGNKQRVLAVYRTQVIKDPRDDSWISRFHAVLFDRDPEWLDEFLTDTLDGRLIPFDVLLSIVTQCPQLLSTRGCAWQLKVNVEHAAYKRDSDFNLEADAVGLAQTFLAIAKHEAQVFENAPTPTKKAVEEWKVDPLCGGSQAYGGQIWLPIFYWLQRTDRINRDELIDRLFDGILSDDEDIQRSARTGMMRLLDAMALSEDEVAGRLDSVTLLLETGVSGYVKYVIGLLLTLATKGAVDIDRFEPTFSEIICQPSATLPKTLIRLLSTQLKNDPPSWQQIEPLLATAAVHSSTDVREAVRKVIAKLPREVEPTTGIWASALELQSPAIRNEFSECLGIIVENDTDDLPEFDKLFDEQIASLETRRDAINVDHWAASRIDDDFKAVHQRRLPAAFNPIRDRAPVLGSLTQYQQLNSIDDVVSAIAAFEGENSWIGRFREPANELERIADAISRLCDECPADFAERIAPAIQPRRTGWNEKALVLDGIDQITSVVYGLTKAWISGRGKPNATRQTVAKVCTGFLRHVKVPLQPMAARFDEMIARVAESVPAQPLATPTHEGGWLDPRVLWDRIIAFPSDVIPRHDFLGAIYRIAPDGRPEVASREIPDDPAKAHAFKALAFACGRDDLDLSECSDSWLAAAASVRSPDDPEAIAKGLGRVLPIRNSPVTPADIATVGRPSQEECDAMLARFGEEFAASGRLNEKLATELQKLKQAAAAPPVPFVVEQVDVPDSADITACMTQLYGYREWLMGRFEMPIPRQDFAAAISLTPHRRDFAIGAAANDLIGEFREANEKPPTEYLPLLDALAHPDQAWDQTANAFLWSCLLQKEGDLKASALDTLIEAIADGRATAESMAGQLTWALKADGVKRRRLTAPLTTLAEIGPLHAAFVAGVGDAVIASLGENTKGAHDILEPMANAITEVGWLLSDDAKAVLKSFKGSSKAAKLAKRILAAPTQLADATLIASLDGRLARLDRWTSAS